MGVWIRMESSMILALNGPKTALSALAVARSLTQTQLIFLQNPLRALSPLTSQHLRHTPLQPTNHMHVLRGLGWTVGS
ncbi:hypothetical protein CesoFtcFv8_020939 [Champsocephalus esox]|uniref:Uncharacterized protein n=1 Tax=Champsocephalus esox TaxID=159716 RepID=A0AAN8BCQ3_9TELE|nr:hypothetical protein CesoFtcFv8_020939 [Champsocephalus esox]